MRMRGDVPTRSGKRKGSAKRWSPDALKWEAGGDHAKPHRVTIEVTPEYSYASYTLRDISTSTQSRSKRES